MKTLRAIFWFYINASIHVAVAVFGMLRITEYYCQLPNNKNLNYFVFLATITGYNFVKYAGVSKLHHISLTKNLKVIQIFSLLTFLIMMYYASLISVKTIYYILPLFLITLLYAVPVLSGFHKNLRQVSSFKIIIVAIVWAITTVIIPIIDSEKVLSVQHIILCLQRFLIVIVLILPFEIRDLQFDAISLQTIPQKIGVKSTKNLGIILMVCSLILEYFISDLNVFKTPFMLFFFLVIVFLMRAKKKQSKYYCAFWVEILPIIWWVLLIIFSSIQ